MNTNTGDFVIDPEISFYKILQGLLGHAPREEIKQSVNMFTDNFNAEYFRTTSRSEMQQTVSVDMTPFERSYYFLQAARTQSHVPSKIMLYCTVLECLLTTDNTELTHKVAERASLLLGDTLEERLEIFDVVKKAYRVRSATTHGDVLRNQLKSFTTQRELAQKVDDYIRKLLEKTLSNIELRTAIEDGKEMSDKFFNKLLLS